MIDLLVIDGHCKFTYSFVRCFDQIKHVRIHIITNDRNSFLIHSGKSIHIHYFKHDYDEKLIDKIIETIRENNISIVFALSEEGIEYILNYDDIIKAITTLCLLPTAESFNTARDKSLLSKHCSTHNINTPESISLKRRQELKYSDLAYLGEKLLIKPSVYSSGGSGIEIFESKKDVLDFFSKDDRPDQDYVIQDYTEGYDICCCFFAQNGEIIAYSIQKGFSKGHHPFAPYDGIEFIMNQKVLLQTQKILKSLNWNGVGCIDMRYDINTDEPYIIDMNCRYWNSLIGSFLSAGVNFPFIHLNYSLNQKIEIKPFCTGTYISAKKYISEKIKGMIHKNSPKIHFRQSGFYIVLSDPKYYFYKSLSKII